MANDVLSVYHSLYGNVVRGLSANTLYPRLDDSIPAGSSDLADQTNPSVLTFQENANVTSTQGITTDGSHWFEVDTGAIRRSVFASGSVTHTNASPFSSLTAGVDHLGGCEVDGTYLYVIAVDWDSGTQTSTSQTIAVYDKTDVSYSSQIDISGSSSCNGSALCIGHTGNFFVASFYNGASPDNRLRDIYEFNSSGTQIAVHTLDEDIVGIQGIAYNSDLNVYVITSYDSTDDYSVVVVDTSFNVLFRANPTGMDNSVREMEDVCYYNGTYYIHESGQPVRNFTLGGMYIHPTAGDTPLFVANADIPDSGSIVIRGTPGAVINYNSFWDNNNSANDWECWGYSDGRVAGRINSGTTAVSAASQYSANTEIIIGFSWAKSGSTVDYDIVVDGSIKQTRTGATWVTPPAGGLYLGGKNASNTIANFLYTDVIVYDKRLSSTEWSTLAGDFDDVYDAVATPGLTHRPLLLSGVGA